MAEVAANFGADLKVRRCRSSAHFVADAVYRMASNQLIAGYVLCLDSVTASTPFPAADSIQVSGGIAWIDDVQQFYRDRSAIEKEYAGKLSALAKRYFEKKAKKAINLSVGETPVVTPGSLER